MPIAVNAYSCWAGYEYWAPDVQGTAHWLLIKEGGPGSRFILYDKPGFTHLAHFGIVTELDQGRRFAWRAPMAEWNMVWIGTDMKLFPRGDGGSHAYHVLTVDMPREYLAVFGGFGRLHGFDIEFETFHIQEEIRGFNELLRAGAFSRQDQEYLFDEDRLLARNVPMDHARPTPYPHELLTLKADTVLTYEEAAVVTAEMLSEAIPGPGFFRKWRDQGRTKRYNREGGGESWLS